MKNQINLFNLSFTKLIFRAKGPHGIGGKGAVRITTQDHEGWDGEGGGKGDQDGEHM